jgi:hypothetical protein
MELKQSVKTASFKLTPELGLEVALLTEVDQVSTGIMPLG